MSYTEFGVKLTNTQAKKLADAIKNKTKTSIRLGSNELEGEHKIPLTQMQINKIKKHKNKGVGVTLHMSQKQLNHMNKTGGVLPLLALLPAIFGGLAAAAGIAGGASGISKAVNDKKANNKMLEEQQRHNAQVEKELSSSGKGLYLNPAKGDGIKKNLRKRCVCGKGYFLNPN